MPLPSKLPRKLTSNWKESVPHLKPDWSFSSCGVGWAPSSGEGGLAVAQPERGTCLRPRGCIRPNGLGHWSWSLLSVSFALVVSLDNSLVDSWIALLLVRHFWHRICRGTAVQHCIWCDRNTAISHRKTRLALGVAMALRSCESVTLGLTRVCVFSCLIFQCLSHCASFWTLGGKDQPCRSGLPHFVDFLCLFCSCCSSPKFHSRERWTLSPEFPPPHPRVSACMIKAWSLGLLDLACPVVSSGMEFWMSSWKPNGCRKGWHLRIQTPVLLLCEFALVQIFLISDWILVPPRANQYLIMHDRRH